MLNILSDSFVSSYKQKKVAWGFASGPNSLGEVTYRRTYRREQEVFQDTLARVINGTYDLIHDHCVHYHIPFDKVLARDEAQEMYDLAFHFKWSPPGRGLWMMGTDFVKERTGACLNNCAFTSTEHLATELEKPFCFLMDMSMLGVGVGFDTRGAETVLWKPDLLSFPSLYVIPDSREGWVNALRLLLRWGFGYGPQPYFDFSEIRLAGEPIRGFGGISSGPQPLEKLLESVRKLIRDRAGKLISITDIVDIMNWIGVCVVAGNVRRTAEIAFGDPDSEEFIDLKNYERNPHRANWGWTSNNSIFARLGQSYSAIADRIRRNGEPGLAWLENMQAYGRMIDPPDARDYRVRGGNPCLEQSLEDKELCCLVEQYPNHVTNKKEFLRTCKYSYLYAKAVTLAKTHWKETNAVMFRNRRIGNSMSGIVQLLDRIGLDEFREWCEDGYQTIQSYDKKFSEWLCIRPSIKTTSIKPSGTVSLLAGATPGCHYPTYNYYLRRVRFAKQHLDLPALLAAGYVMEPSVTDPETMVVEFPVQGPQVPTEQEIPLEKKVELAAFLQAYWADNQVSCTATFDPKTEGEKIEPLLDHYQTRLKGISFLPLQEEGAYPQMPYQAIDEATYKDRVKSLKPIIWDHTVPSQADLETFCDGGTCVRVQP